jgi:hypothetical protein
MFHIFYDDTTSFLKKKSEVYMSVHHIFSCSHEISNAMPQDGSRYLQHLPARMRNEDFAGMEAVVAPTWNLGRSWDIWDDRRLGWIAIKKHGLLIIMEVS